MAPKAGPYSYHLLNPARFGNNYAFVLDHTGRPVVTVGPHWPGVLFTIMMLFCGTTLDRNIVTRNMQKELFSEASANYLYMFMFTMATLSVVFLILTAATDPGIVLGGKVQLPGAGEDEESGIPLRSMNGGRDNHNHGRRTVSGHYCDACDMEQPPKAHHCDDCGVCIYRLDHHW